jgi:ribulose kinase
MSTQTNPPRRGGLVGIDSGTASVEVVVAGHDGVLLTQASVDYPVLHPDQAGGPPLDLP